MLAPFARAVGLHWPGTGYSEATSATGAGYTTSSSVLNTGYTSATSIAGFAPANTAFVGNDCIPATSAAGFVFPPTVTASSVPAAPPVGAIRVQAAPDQPRKPCGFGFAFCMTPGPTGTLLDNQEVQSREETHCASAMVETPMEISPVTVQERLTEAIVNGDASDLREVLADAARVGIVGQDIRRAKDALLAIEAHDTRKRMQLGVEEAVESDDWWRLQACMQAVVGAGFGESDMVVRLREAMRTHKRRKEVRQEIGQAAKTRDAHRLRAAIESALLSHAGENDVRRARDALREMQKRSAAKGGLQKALEACISDLQSLKEALVAAEEANLHEKPKGLLGDDPTERLLVEDAKTELRRRMLDRLGGLHGQRDSEALSAALVEAPSFGVGEAELQAFDAHVAKLRLREKARQELEQALGERRRDIVFNAAASAKEAGIGEEDGNYDADLKPLLRKADEFLKQCDERDKQASAQSVAVDELRTAIAGDVMEELSQALRRAEAAGVGITAEVDIARERLRLLRTRACATRELQEAVQSSNVYRLRAAVTGARAQGVPEHEVRRAREALEALEVKAKSRHCMGPTVINEPPSAKSASSTSSQRNKSSLKELNRNENQANALGPIQEVRDLMAQTCPSPERLRTAARSASDAIAAATAAGGSAGVAASAMGEEVENAWERLRTLERAGWLKQQLNAATVSGEVVRIRAAIKQVELDSESTKDPSLKTVLAKARSELDASSAKHHARQDLSLARVSGNPESMLAAIKFAAKAGIPRGEYEADVQSLGIDLEAVMRAEEDEIRRSAGRSAVQRGSKGSSPRHASLPILLGAPGANPGPDSVPKAGARSSSPHPGAQNRVRSQRRVRFDDEAGRVEI